MAGFADVAGAGSADLDTFAVGLMDVAAAEIFGLVFFDEFENRARGGVQARAYPIQRGAAGRRVADQDQRRERREGLQVFGELSLAVFAGSVERRGVGIAESRDVPAAELQMAFVEVVETAERAHVDDFASRFMIAGQHVDLVAAAFEDLAVAVDAFIPCTLIAVGDVEIGFHREQFLEPLPIVVNVGEQEELHSSTPEIPLSSCYSTDR